MSTQKREQQRLRKESKQKAAAQRARVWRLVALVCLFVALPALVLAALYAFFSQPPSYSPVQLAETDHIRGETDDQRVPVVVYADFQCPACATEFETMERIWPRINDKAYLVFRHYPITSSHRNTWDASRYAEAAARQGKFWEMHDLLFINQRVWAALGNATDEFELYARELGLDPEQLHADLASGELEQKIRADRRSGTNSGVNATPALFVNGTRLPVDGERIVQAVTEAYEAAIASE